MTTAALKKKIKALVDRTSHEGKLNRVLAMPGIEQKWESEEVEKKTLDLLEVVR